MAGFSIGPCFSGSFQMCRPFCHTDGQINTDTKAKWFQFMSPCKEVRQDVSVTCYTQVRVRKGMQGYGMVRHGIEWSGTLMKRNVTYVVSVSDVEYSVCDVPLVRS